MSNTLKFGNGEWYGKEGTILAYNDENNNYKPLPFTFDRDSVATRVNKQGLIETVGADQPRIDYLNDSNGALKLEPSRTNLVTYSEDFSNAYWTKTSVTVTSNEAISPDGTLNADKLVENTQNTAHIIFASPTITLGNNTFSVFAKAAERRVLGIEFPSNGILVSFDLIDGVFVNQQANPDNFSITPFSNGWYRIDITENLTSNSVVSLSLRDENGNRVYQGDGTSGVYIWGAQLEVGSYATSIIKTQGSAVTRVDDNTKIVNSPILQATNQFTLFFDAKDFVNYGTTFANIMFTLGAGESAYDVGTGIHIYNKIWYYFNGSSAVTLGDCYNATTDSKFAISYDGTKFTRYANGVKLGTNTVSASMSNWDTLTNGNLSYSGVDRVFDLADLKLYDTALTDQEAIALTQV